jgi:hypothetical protein
MDRDKRFLNESHAEFGSISWYVKQGGGHYLSSHAVSISSPSNIASDLRLTDCGHNIVLEFSAYKYKHVVSRLAKLDALIDSLVEFRAAYIKQAKATTFKS